MDSFLKKVLKGSSVTLLSMIIIKAMALVNSIIAARLLSPEGYGSLSIVVNLQNLTIMAACLGIPLAMTKEVAHNFGKDRSIAETIGSTLLVVLLLSSTLTSILYLILSGTIAADLYGQDELAPVLRLSAIFVAVSAANLGLSALVQGSQRITDLAKINAVVAVLAQPLALIMIGFLDLPGAILAMLSATMVSAGLFYRVIRATLRLSLRKGLEGLKNRTRLKCMMGFALPAFVSGLTLVIAYWIGRTVLALQWDLDSVGRFQIGDSLSQLLLVVGAAASVPLLPLMAELNSDRPHMVAARTGQLLRISAVLALPTAFLVLPFLGFAINTLYGSTYDDTQLVTSILFASAAFKVTGTAISNAIFGTGRAWDAMIIDLIWLFSFILILLATVKSGGAEGLALTYAISFLVQLMILLVYFRWRFGYSVSRVTIHVFISLPLVAGYIASFDSFNWAARSSYAIASFLLLLAFGFLYVLSQDERRKIRSLGNRLLQTLSGD